MPMPDLTRKWRRFRYAEYFAQNDASYAASSVSTPKPRAAGPPLGDRWQLPRSGQTGPLYHRPRRSPLEVPEETDRKTRLREWIGMSHHPIGIPISEEQRCRPVIFCWLMGWKSGCPHGSVRLEHAGMHGAPEQPGEFRARWIEVSAVYRGESTTSPEGWRFT